ncbi:PhzF family phenazine biosynthesis protein, partial [Mesorhizobium waimense]
CIPRSHPQPNQIISVIQHHSEPNSASIPSRRHLYAVLNRHRHAESAKAHFVSRYFAPGAGIPEDPVTGSIHATLVPYWAKRLGCDKLLTYQASARGGWLVCELTKDRVFLSGNAVTFMEAEISIPNAA